MCYSSLGCQQHSAPYYTYTDRVQYQYSATYTDSALSTALLSTLQRDVLTAKQCV